MLENAKLLATVFQDTDYRKLSTDVPAFNASAMKYLCFLQTSVLDMRKQARKDLFSMVQRYRRVRNTWE